MNQYILIETYAGLSDFTFDMYCSGRKLELSEVKSRGFVDDVQLKSNERSSYVNEWYEVKPGDFIFVKHRNDDFERLTVFRIPESGLVNPGTTLDLREAHQTGWFGYHIEDCLKEQCEVVMYQEEEL